MVSFNGAPEDRPPPPPLGQAAADGNNLLEIYNRTSDFVIVNGFYDKNKKFDSNFTFYCGNVRSQVDLVISNRINDIISFTIMDKYIFSDL